MCDRTKFQQNRPDGFGDITIFRLSRWLPYAILDFEIFKLFVNLQIGRPNMHRRTKFHQNRPNGFWDITIFYFQDGRHLPSLILKFLIDRHIGKPNMHPCTKFHENQSNGCWDIAFNNFQNGRRCHLGVLKVWYFDQLVSSGGHICGVMQTFVKISQTVSEILRFFNFQDGSHPPSWILKFSNS